MSKVIISGSNSGGKVAFEIVLFTVVHGVYGK